MHSNKETYIFGQIEGWFVDVDSMFKRDIKRDHKRDVCTSKETYKRNLRERPVYMKRDLQKRPICLKTDTQKRPISKETYKTDQLIGQT